MNESHARTGQKHKDAITGSAAEMIAQAAQAAAAAGGVAAIAGVAREVVKQRGETKREALRQATERAKNERA